MWFYGQMRQNIDQQNTQGGFVIHKGNIHIKKNLIPTVMYSGGTYVWCSRAVFSSKSSGNAARIRGIMDSMEICYGNLTASAKTSQPVHGWIFQLDNDSKYMSKYALKNGSMVQWPQNQASDMAVPVFWPEPHWKTKGWAEEENLQEKSENPGGCGEILHWGAISDSLLCDLIEHYRRKVT